MTKWYNSSCNSCKVTITTTMTEKCLAMRNNENSLGTGSLWTSETVLVSARWRLRRGKAQEAEYEQLPEHPPEQHGPWHIFPSLSKNLRKRFLSPRVIQLKKTMVRIKLRVLVPRVFTTAAVSLLPFPWLRSLTISQMVARYCLVPATGKIKIIAHNITAWKTLLFKAIV